jgi:hypothetical protein
MALGQSERWITPSDWENKIGHDGQFGDDESDRERRMFKTETKGREEGKYVSCYAGALTKRVIHTFSPVTL